MQAFYDVLFQHWDKPIKDLRAVKKQGKFEVQVIEILDDDIREGGSIEELEAKSLQDAEQGIIIYGGITDDGYSWDSMDETGDPVGGNCDPEPVASEPVALNEDDSKEERIRRDYLIRHFVAKLFLIFQIKVWGLSHHLNIILQSTLPSIMSGRSWLKDNS